MEKSALVIGGGITGIQTALDLANSQVHVYILENSPSIGGRMAQLDKTFPTNDCSMCILSPKLVEANRHPNITIFTYADLEKVTGESGNFKVCIKKNAKFVDESKCIGCGICAEKCPVKVPNEFDVDLGIRKAIYIPFPQAVPLKYTIDKDNCIFFKNGKCKACLKFCSNKAPDFDQQDEFIDLDIGSIIVATGFDVYQPSDRPEYGYNEHKDVITSLEFERMLSPSGPTAGSVLRLSDDSPAKKIVFVQCVGSRNNNNGVPYCSRICCMYSLKEALIAKEHSNDIEDLTILYTDIRAFGKNFDAYYHRAKYEEGVRFKRGYSTEISTDPETGKLLVYSEDTETGELSTLEADLVVLATAVLPSKTNKRISEILGIELDENGFFKTASEPASLIDSTTEGIYLCGCAAGPKDIPDGVASSSAAASKALENITRVPVKEDTKAVKLPASELDGTPRIGVFVCHCGTNIGSVVDVESVAKFAENLPYVVYTDNNLFTCSDATQQQIKDAISGHNLNRVVVASCTPRTHEPLFQDTINEAGLNPYLFEMANIREHCSWVHKGEADFATEKAKELLKMAVAKAAKLEELERQTFDLNHTAAVIGGGISGIQTAIDLARKGISTYLIEKDKKLGGRLNELSTLSISNAEANDILQQKLEELKALKSNLTVITDAELQGASGSIGNFELEIKEKTGTQNLSVGAVIIATGADVYQPKDEFAYDKHDHVITNLELERNLRSRSPLTFDFGKPKSAVYILCVGSRTLPEGDLQGSNENIDIEESNPTNPGCSRICCDIGIKHGLALQDSGIQTTVLYRDIRTFDKGAEEQYYKAGNSGVNFIRYDTNKPPELDKDGKSIKVFDTLSQEEIELESDLVVLGCGLIPRIKDSDHIQNLFKVPRGSDGFFMEAHPKLAPLETTTGGIYLCGTASYPKSISESITQGGGAALKANILLSSSALSTEPIVASVDQDICWGCGTCVDVCIYGAPTLIVVKEGESRVSYINPTLCKGCGSCAARCPSGAITANLFTDIQIISMIEALEDET